MVRSPMVGEQQLSALELSRDLVALPCHDCRSPLPAPAASMAFTRLYNLTTRLPYPAPASFYFLGIFIFFIYF